MQSIICFLLGLFLSSSLYSQDTERLVFPDFDQQLMLLWLASGDGDQGECRESVRDIKANWESISSDLLELDLPHINVNDFVKRVDSYVLSLDKCLDPVRFSCLRSVSYHILFEFRSLRQCLFATEYPVDLLWESMDAYMDIKSTIKDRMFNLKEWFEFEDDVTDFICTWEYYDLRHIDEIRYYFPGIKKESHNALKQKLNTCIYSLLKSFESGYQSDFQLPCDELGYAMEDLFRLYAKSRITTLM